MRARLASLRWLVLLALFAGGCSQAGSSGWPEWDGYVERFVQADGRVIDVTFDQKSTSEGQSYGLFFALVANDRARFDKIATWTSQNLANGHLGDELPGWLWGRRDDGSWGLKEKWTASDGDMWTAYALLEAGRLWSKPAYTDMGRRLLAQIAEHDVVEWKGGKQLIGWLPGDFAGQRVIPIDPSYMPPFQFRYFGLVDPKGPWLELLEVYRRLWPQVFEKGIAPDMVMIRPDGSAAFYPPRPTASYDAIRVYLWAAMANRDGVEQLKYLGHFAELIRETGAPPETIEVATGKAVPKDYSPIGFMACALPYLQAIGEQPLADKLRERMRLARLKAQLTRSSNYYDESLVLFSLGYLDGYYRFDEQGRLQPKWAKHP